MLFHASGSLFPWCLPLQPPFSQFLRYSSSQEGLITILSPPTPTFFSINYTCHHHSCCNSLLFLFAFLSASPLGLLTPWYYSSSWWYVSFYSQIWLIVDICSSVGWLTHRLCGRIYCTWVKMQGTQECLTGIGIGVGSYQSLLWLGSTAQ